MSAVETPSTTKESKTQATTVLPLARRIGDALEEMDTLISQDRDIRSALGFVRVKIGHLFVEKLAALAKAGKTGEAAQTAILALLGSRTDENGKPYSWTTVDAWIVAARTEATLPDDLHHVFNSDGLRVGARVAKKEKENENAVAEFLAPLAKNGKTSVRQVRAAFTEKYGESGKRQPKSDAMVAEDIRKGGAEKGDNAKIAATLRKTLKRNNIGWNIVRPVAVFAATLGQANPSASPEAIVSALNMLMDAKQDEPKTAKAK